jgi:hypothetical protein
MAHTRWSDLRDEHIERVGRPEFEAGKEQMLAEARGWRLAEIRKRRGLTQAQVADRMGGGKEPDQPDRERQCLHPRCSGPVRGGARRTAEPDGRLRRRTAPRRLTVASHVR